MLIQLVTLLGLYVTPKGERLHSVTLTPSTDTDPARITIVTDQARHRYVFDHVWQDVRNELLAKFIALSNSGLRAA